MGLRTASVRRPHAEVMAPALTDTTQSRTFKLSPNERIVGPKSPSVVDDGGKRDAADRRPMNDGLTKSDDTPTMDVHRLPDTKTMGLERNDDESLEKKLHKANDVDQIINSMMTADGGGSIVSSGNGGSGGGGDLAGQNVDEIMQVIKSIEPSDIDNEVFTNNIALDKILNDVDMMNISMEEQQELENVDVRLKETKSKEMIDRLKEKMQRSERRLEFLRRRTLKLQARHMGLHASGEMLGIFEQIHRSLTRSGEQTENDSVIGGVWQLCGGGEDTTNEGGRPMTCGTAKALLKKLEMTAKLQTNSASRHRNASRYFGSGSYETVPYRAGGNNVPGMISVPQWPTETKEEMLKVTGMLATELRFVQDEIDSEATESSSGGDSCDEMQTYNNPHQQYLSIQKRALWKYSVYRAAIAARWTWLQAQISDLEYRIRQHKDLHRHIRARKGAVTLGGTSPPHSNSSTNNIQNANVSDASSVTTTINGYRGQLPGQSPIASKMSTYEDPSYSLQSPPSPPNGLHSDYQSARTRPLVNFKKRKLLLTSGLHIVSKKAARPSTIRCGCVQPVSCALCTGRIDPTHPRDPPETLSKSERIALLDPGYHPIISMPEDVSCSTHFDAILKIPESQQRCTRMKSLKAHKGDRNDKTMIDGKNFDHRKKFNRLLKPSTVSALSAKIKNKIKGRKMNRHFRLNKKRSTAKVAMAQLQALASDGADEEVEAIAHNSLNITRSENGSPSSSPLLHMQAISGFNKRNRVDSYDIDNIVIPYSVAASTRVEKLQYKEILTPKWRIAEPDYKCDIKSNGAVRNPSQDSDAEDLAEEAVIARHDRCEHDEKKKFLSYLKFPLGYGRSRSHKRTDSLAESSGANTPDPMSPHPIEAVDNGANTNTNGNTSPLASPPATPAPLDDPVALQGVRRRTTSQSRMWPKDGIVAIGANREENGMFEYLEVAPYDTRIFPLDDETYNRMLKSMPENHQFKTNYRAQDSNYYGGALGSGYLDEKVGSPDSETTESALGDEDPNDPEWMDMERSKDRHKR